MKNSKKFAALFLAAALVAACAGCGNDAGSSGSESVSGEVSDSSSEESSEESSASSEESNEESNASSEESGASSEESSAEGSDSSDAESAEGGEASGEVLSYADYMAAEMDTQVVVETYVQAKQSWWEDKATLYTQDQDGGYFVYNMACSEEDYAKLTPGTKIRVTGFKGEWSGEVEIMDATFEFVEGGDTFIAEPKDGTSRADAS